MIPVENNCELMDRLYDFLAPTLEQEDLFLIRSPVCLTLDVRAYCCVIGLVGPLYVTCRINQLKVCGRLVLASGSTIIPPTYTSPQHIC